MMNKNDEYVSWDAYTHVERRLYALRLLGLSTHPPKRVYKIVLGVVCLVIAVVPNGLGLLFYPLGAWLCTTGGYDVVGTIRSRVQRIRMRWY